MSNISAALGNNQASNRHTIPDGYYNACQLDEEVFQPLGTELRLHAPTSRLQLSAKKRLALNSRLAKLLGFTRRTFEPGKTDLADEQHRLNVHRKIYVHLAEVSTSENLHNGRPSALLRSVPVENERCGVAEQTFPTLQYKMLALGAHPQLTLTVLDVIGKKLDFDHLSAVLHIRNDRRGWPWERQKMPWRGFI